MAVFATRIKGPREEARVRAAAEAEGMTVSGWMRRLVLAHARLVVPDEDATELSAATPAEVLADARPAGAA